MSNMPASHVVGRRIRHARAAPAPNTRIHGDARMRRFPIWLWLGLVCLPAASQAAPQSEQVEALLTRLEARAAQLQDYTVVGEGIDRGKPRRFKFYFKSPHLVRIDTPRGQVTVQPNGEIRGRLGHGLFGWVSRRLGRD